MPRIRRQSAQDRDELSKEFDYKEKILTEAELENLDLSFGKISDLRISGREKNNNMLIPLDAAVQRNDSIGVIPDKMRASTDTIDQWLKWKARRTPFDKETFFAETRRMLSAKGVLGARIRV